MNQGHRSMPILPAKDIAEAVAFYSNGLGFSLAGILKNDDGQDNFAIVQLDDITVGLKKSDRNGSGEDWAAYFYLEDLSVFVDQIQGNGVRIARGPEVSFYHCKEVEVVDPQGNQLCFAQDLKPGENGPGL